MWHFERLPQLLKCDFMGCSYKIWSIEILNDSRLTWKSSGVLGNTLSFLCVCLFSCENVFAIPFGLLNSLFSSLCYLETVSIRYAFVFFCFVLLCWWKIKSLSKYHFMSCNRQVSALLWITVLKIRTQCFSKKFWKFFFMIFSFLLKRSFQTIFSCLENLNGSA